MDTTKVEQKVQGIVADQLGLDESEVTPEKKIYDLGADSLDIVEIAMALEEEFEVSMPDVELEEALAAETATVQTLTRYVSSKLT